MAEELRPCPFCGGEAHAALAAYASGATAHVVCDGCGAKVYGYSRGERGLRDAVESWNRRSERTCRMGAPIDGEYRCGECGHLNRETYRADKGWYPPEYCAHCGAKAVDE